MYPGGYYTSYALTSHACNNQSTSPCGTGGLWNVEGGQTGNRFPITYEPVIDLTASSGLYETGLIYAQNMDIGSGGSAVTAPNASLCAVKIANQTLPNGKQINLEVGALALGADQPKQVFTAQGNTQIDTWVFPGYLFKQGLAQSYSFGLHIGSTAFKYPGSLIFGGYDKGRAIGPEATYGDSWPTLKDIELGAITGGSPFQPATRSGLLLTNTSKQAPIITEIEPLVPGLYLPQETCDNLARHLPIMFDSVSGYYLWNTGDPAYKDITTSTAYLGFKFPPATGKKDDVTIKVPLQLLVLNLTSVASGKSALTPYFPCMPYDPPDGNYLLGRAFLQAAFWGRNFNQHVSWLAQAPGPGASKAGLGSQPTDISDADTTLNLNEGSNLLADSWSQYWKPLPASTKPYQGSSGKGSSSNNGSSGGGGLSTGAKVGIGIGVAAAVLILLAVALFCCFRRRRTRKDSGSTQESSVAAHYGDKPKPQAGQQYYDPSTLR